MHKQKWISFVLCLALIVTAFVGTPIAANAAQYGGPMNELMRLTFTKAEAATAPDPAPFTPGSGGTVTLPAITWGDIFPGLYIQENEYYYGSSVYPEISLAFPKASNFGFAGWTLQEYVDGVGSWITSTNRLGGDAPYTVASDVTSMTIYPTQSALYRLVSNTGATTNVVDGTLPSLETSFNAWYTDGSYYVTGVMPPFVGCGASVGGITASSQEAIELSDGDLLYQWYRVNPATFEMTEIEDATDNVYATTIADAGYCILCKVSGDNVDVGGYLQFMPLADDIISIPVQAYVSNATTSGFDLMLEYDIDNLAVDDLYLDTYEGTPCTITNVESIGGSKHAYRVTVDGYAAFPADQKFTLGSEREGLFIGEQMISDTPDPYVSDPNGLTARSDLPTPVVTVTSTDTDQVYGAGDTFSCEIDVSDICSEVPGITNGSIVRVAMGQLSATPGSIYPFVQAVDPSSSVGLFASGDVLTASNGPGNNYSYGSKTITNGKVTVSGIVDSGIAPSALGLIIVTGDGSAAISNWAIVKSSADQVMFGVENALPEFISANPSFDTITDFYSIDQIEFSTEINATAGIYGSMTFHNINLMQDYNELMMLGDGLIMDPNDKFDISKGVSMGLDEFMLNDLANYGATLQLTGLDGLEAMLNDGVDFTAEDFVITGEAISGAAVYDSTVGTLTFDVGHFSTYQVLFADAQGGTPPPDSATGAAFEAIYLVYNNNWGNEQRLTVGGIEGTTCQMTLHDNLTPGAVIGVDALIPSESGAEISMKTPAQLDMNLHGYAAIGISMGGIEQVYTIEIQGDARSLNVEDCQNNLLIDDYPDEDGMYMRLSAIGRYGAPCNPQDLGTLQVDYVAGEDQYTPLSTSAYTYNSSTNELVILPQYLVSLTEGLHNLRVSVVDQNADEFSIIQNIDVMPNTARIYFEDPANGSIEVYAFEWDEINGVGTQGAIISSGASVQVGGPHEIEIHFTGTDRVSEAAITEYYYNNNYWTSDVTELLSKWNGVMYWQPYGDAYLSVVTEPIPETLPEITSIELFKYDEDTETATPVTSTTTGISIDDIISAKVQFSTTVTEASKAYVNYFWQDQQEDGTYSDDSYIDNTIPERINLRMVEDVVSDNYVRLTVNPVTNYTTGDAIEIEFFVNSGKADQPTPAAVTGAAATSAQNNDGKLLNTDTSMEYKLQGAADSTYTTCSAQYTVVPEPGVYLVRYKETSDLRASAPVTVVVLPYAPQVISVTGVTVNPNTLTMAIGGQASLTAQISPDNANNQAIIWSSSNPSVATVSNGAVLAVGLGNATVSAITSDGGFHADCRVSVKANIVSVSGITAVSKAYDGTTVAAFTGTPVLNGVTQDDDVTLVTQPAIAAFADKNAGTGKNVTVLGYTLTGADAAKYSLATVSLTAGITKLTLTASAINQQKTAGTANPVPVISYVGFITGETATNSGITAPVASHTAATNSQAGTYDINLTGGSGGQNYNLTTVKGTLTVVRSDIALTGIALQKHSTTLLAGASETLAVDFTPTNASIKTIYWSTSNAAIATVDATGKVTGVGAGTVTVTAIAQDGGFLDSCSVTVQTPVSLVGSLAYNDGSSIPASAGVYQLSGTKYPFYDAKYAETNLPLKLTLTGSGTELNDQTQYTLFLSMGPSNSTTMTKSGAELRAGTIVEIPRIQALTDAAHTFTVILKDGATTKASITTKIIISGTPIPPTGVSLPVSQLNMAVGDTYNLSATILPYNATDRTVTWSSSNTGVAEVNASTGAITAKAAGTATITATTNTRSLTAAAIVNIGANITGKILKDGQPLEGAWVYLYNASENFAGYCYTGASGNLTFSGIKVGNYTIRSYSYDSMYGNISTSVAISSGDATVNVGNLNFVSAYPNSGILTISLEDKENPGTPYQASGDVYISVYSYETGKSVYRALTDAEKLSGTVTIGGISYKDGGTSYDLSISTSDFWDYRTVNMNASAVTETFQIPVRYSISGIMTLTDQTAVPYSYAVAEKSTGEWYYGYTDNTGSFRITGLQAGDYTLKPYDSNRYTYTPIDISGLSSNLTGQNLVVSEGAELTGHVLKDGVDAYKAYLYLYKNANNDNDTSNDNWSYVSGTSAGGSAFFMDGILKEDGEYKLELSYIGEKNGTYPPFVSTPLIFKVSDADIATGRVSKDITYTYPTNAADVFKGTGNSVLTTKTVVRNGSELSLVIKYKNAGNSNVSATFGASIPAGVTSSPASVSFNVTDLAPGASGQQNFALKVTNATSNYISIPVKVTIGGIGYDFGTATMEVAGVTLSGPGAAKLNTPIKVYGEATADSTVVIKDAITGQNYATVKPSGRFYSSDITLSTEGTATLVAEVTTSNGAVSALSSTLSVEVKADQISIEKVKSDSAGISDMAVNKVIGVRTMMAWVDGQLNGRTISIGTLFDKTNLINSVTYHFSGNDYTATKDGEGYFVANLSNWSGSGLKTITATVRTTDQRTLTFIIAEVTVLIDPSGYVTDKETGEPITGAAVTCEKYVTSSATWVKWTTDPSQDNPQSTDSNGHYGWDVEEGTYRVVATKTGYSAYATSEDTDPNLNSITIPPARSDIDFAMTPTVLVSSVTLNHDTLEVNEGSTAQLIATANPTNALNKNKITWQSSDSTVATVNATGGITAIKAGNVTISAIFARDSGFGADLTAACAVTVAAVATNGPTGGDGGVGAQLPGTQTQTAAGKTTITAAIEGTTANGQTTAAVPAATVTTLIDSAKQAETGGKKAVMEFSVQAPANANQVSLEIPKASFSQIASQTNADVSFNGGLATLTFDEKAVQSVNAAGTGDVSISIAKVDATQLSADAREAVGDRPVYDFTVKAGSTEVSSFNGGSVAVSIPYSLGSGEDPDAVVVYYIDSTGSLKTIRGCYNSTTKSVDFTTAHFSKYAVGYNEVSFTDVSAGAWYNDAVTFMAARGITTGTSEGVFSPSVKLTRAQFLVMALRAYGIEADANTASNFSDAGNTYYTGYLAAAKRLGISNGDGNGHFQPNAQIRRQDMFVLLYRTLNVLGELPEAQSTATLAQFTDAANVSSYATEAMTALVKANVVSGSNGKLDPAGLSSRAQMAQVLYNLLAK